MSQNTPFERDTRYRVITKTEEAHGLTITGLYLEHPEKRTQTLVEVFNEYTFDGENIKYLSDDIITLVHSDPHDNNPTHVFKIKPSEHDIPVASFDDPITFRFKTSYDESTGQKVLRVFLQNSENHIQKIAQFESFDFSNGTKGSEKVLVTLFYSPDDQTDNSMHRITPCFNDFENLSFSEKLKKLLESVERGEPDHKLYEHLIENNKMITDENAEFRSNLIL